MFLLREVFDYDYAEIAAIVGKSATTCRQLFSRSKKHIAEHRPRFKSSPEEHRRIVVQFVEAIQAGELEGLTKLLADDVTLWSDGGGKVFAATAPVYGRERVGKFLIGSRKQAPEEVIIQFADINGKPGAILRTAENRVFLVITLEVDNEKIETLRIIGNPDKLNGL